MKKTYLIFGIIMMVLFLPNCFAKSYYTNNNGVSLTEKEYSFISNMFYIGFQETLTPEDYNNIFENDQVVNSTIEKETIFENDSKNINLKTFTKSMESTMGTYFETASKKITISKSCTTNCLVTIYVEWKKTPSVRSYDVVGALIKDTSIVINPVTRVSNSTGVNSSNEKVTNSNGFGVSIKLLPSGNDMRITQYFSVKKGGTVYGSYQHAKKSISLANSKKYTISYSGLGNVFLFNNLTLRNHYDGMSGVSISV